jgi:hypothetical protein
LSGSTSGSPWRTSSSFRNCVAMISRCLTDCLSVCLTTPQLNFKTDQSDHQQNCATSASCPSPPPAPECSTRFRETDISADMGPFTPIIFSSKKTILHKMHHITHPKKKNTSLRITLSESLSEPDSSPWNQCKHDGLVPISLEQSLPVFLQLPSLLHPPYTRVGPLESPRKRSKIQERRQWARRTDAKQERLVFRVFESGELLLEIRVVVADEKVMRIDDNWNEEKV